MTKIIDLEAHFITPEFAEYIRTLPGARPTLPGGDMVLDLGEKRIGDMVEHGIDMQVLSLVTPPHIQMFEPSVAKKWARQTNNALSAAVKKYPDRFVGLAAIPVQSPKDAVEELERAVKKLGLKGVCIESHARNEYLDDKKYWVIFEKVEELDVPVYLHPSTPSAGILTPYMAYNGRLSGPALGYSAEVSLHVMRLIFSGLFDRYPRLKFILGHMGEGLPYWFPRLDFAWERGSMDRPAIEKRPSEYLKRNFTVDTSGMFFQPALICAYLAMGADRIGFAVDYPMENTGKALQFMKEAPICDSDKEKIYHGNAEALFNL